ncbi:MAG: hypothetical protein GY822_06855 [Deltaproteobacteria bacterium]|nr:hypothetical protein [Deltaproteobacteria bacterium]
MKILSSSMSLLACMSFALLASCASTKEEQISPESGASDVKTEAAKVESVPSQGNADAGNATSDLADGGVPTSKSQSPDLSKVSRQPKKPLQIFDRIIVKVLDENLDDELLKKSVETATGKKVVNIKHASLGIRLVQFAPLDPPRDLAAQQELVKVLQDIPSFKYVEGDRWLTPKEQ